MKKLIIVGAGGFGREVFSYAQHIQATRERMGNCGFYR